MSRAPDVVIVVPPFAGIDRPSLGAHVLQTVATEQNFYVKVLYANIVFASLIGEIAYTTISTYPPLSLLGERLFATEVHGKSFPDVEELVERTTSASKLLGLAGPVTLDRNFFVSAAQQLGDIVVALLENLNPSIIGFSSTFEQTNSALALIRRLRPRFPQKPFIIGGANCEGEMAKGIAALMPEVDFIFSGESEETFVSFLKSFQGNVLNRNRIIDGTPLRNLEALPTNDYDDYFQMFDEYLPKSTIRQTGNQSITYETSRGCWWGAKHHCTFCGLNGGGMAFREKNALKVLRDFDLLAAKHGLKKIILVDNIMPAGYFETLLPALKGKGFDLFYEQKANLSLEKVRLLKAAGIDRIQPLSTPQLKAMKKGTSARQNISLLRYARACGLSLSWNMLHGVPFEERDWYSEVAVFLPLLQHLEPPTGLSPISIDRFSPYFQRPGEFGLSNRRPHPSYALAFPSSANLDELAYHFVADRPEGLADDDPIFVGLRETIALWKERWAPRASPPMLHLIDDGNHLILLDTRDVSGSPFTLVLPEQGRAILSEHSPQAAKEWCIERRYAIVINDEYIPLATASAELLATAQRLN